MEKINISHVYDVDAVATFTKLKKALENGPEQTKSGASKSEYLTQLQIALEEFLKFEKIDIDQVLPNKIAVKVYPTEGLGRFEFWMALQLMTTNYRTIPLFLDYHFKTWKKSNRFLDLLEYRIIPIFEKSKPADLDQETDAIYNWLRNERKNLDVFPSPVNKTLDSVFNQKETEREIKSINQRFDKPTLKIEANFIDTLVNLFSSALENIDQKVDLQHFFEGKKPKNMLRIKWKKNYFGFVFSRLKSNKRGYIVESDESISLWCAENMLFFDENKKQYVVARAPYLKKCIDGTKAPSEIDQTEIKKAVDKILRDYEALRVKQGNLGIGTN